jgi:hypothetical protein
VNPERRLRRRRGAIVAGVGVVLVVGWVTPGATAGWSPPATVSTSVTFIHAPFVGFGASGRGLATWGFQQGIGEGATAGVRGAARGLDGRFGPERKVPGTPVLYGPDRAVVAVERSRIVAGRERARLRVAFGSISGRFGPARTIDRYVSWRGPQLAANDHGRVAVAYVQRLHGRRRVVTLAERAPGRRFGQPRVFPDRGGPVEVAVAVGPSGDLVVAYKFRDKVVARVRPAGGRLGPPVRIGPSASQIGNLRAAVSASGAVWVAWLSTRRPEEHVYELRLAVRPATARRFRASRLLDREVRLFDQDAAFDLALDPAGAGFLAWSGWDGAQLRARLASIGARGRPIAIRTLSAPGYGAAVSDLATSRRRGEALVAWARLDAAGQIGSEVRAGLIAPGGAYAGEEIVSDPDRARIPAAAFDPVSGNPTIVWSQRIGPDGPGVPIAQVQTVLRASTRTP